MTARTNSNDSAAPVGTRSSAARRVAAACSDTAGVLAARRHRLRRRRLTRLALGLRCRVAPAAHRPLPSYRPRFA